MAAASLWLASKLEENCKRVRDVIMVNDRLLRRREGRPTTVIEPGSLVSCSL